MDEIRDDKDILLAKYRLALEKIADFPVKVSGAGEAWGSYHHMRKIARTALNKSFKKLKETL